VRQGRQEGVGQRAEEAEGRGGRQADRGGTREVVESRKVVGPDYSGLRLYDFRLRASRTQLPADGGAMDEPTKENVLLALLPRVVMAAMHTTTIRASITAYSTAVGPSSAFRNETSFWVRQRIRNSELRIAGERSAARRHHSPSARRGPRAAKRAFFRAPGFARASGFRTK